MAISASNTGGAWDNAKKYISKGAMDALIGKLEPDCVSGGRVNTKSSQIFKAAVTGDTVGDPLKDTSGPALNILMKLMAIISVVFAEVFMAINGGRGLIGPYIRDTSAVVMPQAMFTLPEVAAAAGPVSIFAIFVGGVVLGMGALVAGQRAVAAPASMVKSVALKEPLLVARAEGAGSTPMMGLRSAYSPAAF
jgi:inorganic pyrophosphatase